MTSPLLRTWSYEFAKSLVSDIELPAMLVDESAVIANLAVAIKSVGNKKIRLATKSLRVPHMIQLLLERGGGAFSGIMCFSAREAEALAVANICNDILMGYPIAQKTDLERIYTLLNRGTRVTVMVDSLEHMRWLDSSWQAAKQRTTTKDSDTKLDVCIDVDASLRIGGQHLGVQRSPLRSTAEVESLIIATGDFRNLNLKGIMSYEAQIAGLGDRSPFKPILNPIKSAVREKSKTDIRARREEIAQMCQRRNVTLSIFNGGGTGSVLSTAEEPWITEVTIGSGFLNSHLFDYYSEAKSKRLAWEPAMVFALPVTRRPEANIVTCQSGGFVASGEPGWDKCPVVFLPRKLEPIRSEGFGEVQTPLRGLDAASLQIGEPVFFRPAKAGEPAERFNHYYLVRDGKIVAKMPTYRGQGWDFF